MKCLVKRKFETGYVTVEEVNLLHFIQHPSNRPKKELPLWRFCTLKEGAPKKACSDNYDSIHMLILEFDHGVLIADAEKMADKYAYAIHTTSSHTATDHRFRLMLPLDMEYPEEFWRMPDVKHAVKQLFPGLDPTSFVNYQCIPALPANPEDYYWTLHKGRKFGLADIESMIEQLELDRQLEAQFKASLKPKSTFVHDESSDRARSAYKAKVDESMDRLVASLPSHSTGSRYSDFCKAIGKMLNAKYPDEDFIYTTEEIKQRLKAVYWDHALDKAFRAFSRRRH